MGWQKIVTMCLDYYHNCLPINNKLPCLYETNFMKHVTLYAHTAFLFLTIGT